MWRATALTVTILTGLVLLGGGCFGASNGSGSSNGGDTGQRASDARRRYPLDSLPTTTITIGEHEFHVWLVQESDETRPGALSEGLMHVPTSEIEDNQGMLFVFSDERQRGFWMLNTIAPLDIAYARFDGTIVKIGRCPRSRCKPSPRSSRPCLRSRSNRGDSRPWASLKATA